MSARVKYVVYSLAVGLGSLVLIASCASAQAPAPIVKAPIASRALARGAVLTADDIVYRDTVVRIPLDTNHVGPGWVTRRVIAIGEVLRSPAVVPPAAVQANQIVTIEWAEPTIKLTLRGTVLRTAAIGERVPVRTEAGRRIDAVVIAPGRVRID